MIKLRTILRGAFFIGVGLLLSGCKFALLDPKGRIALAEKHLLAESVILMLIIVIPVILLTLFVSWRYRSKNRHAEYRPNWAHSNAIEVVCWGVPLILIVCLAYLTWTSTHALNPYKPIEIKGKQTEVIQVVALDWKWLFIYPNQHIATVNYVEIPTHTPVRFEITADAPMNSLEIPQLAGQIYAMAAMRTQLNLTADYPGIYKGFSANYSGDGFAEMKFNIHAVSTSQFNQWISHIRHTASHTLNFPEYVALRKASIGNKPEFFSGVRRDLFHRVIYQYINPADKIPTAEHHT